MVTQLVIRCLAWLILYSEKLSEPLSTRRLGNALFVVGVFLEDNFGRLAFEFSAPRNPLFVVFKRFRVYLTSCNFLSNIFLDFFAKEI